MFPSSSFVSANSPQSSVSKSSSSSCQLNKNSATLVHKQLEDEAEKLRQWRLQTELDLKERANQVEELTKVNDRLNRELNEEKQRSASFRSHNQCLKQDLDGLEGVIGDAKKTIEFMKNFAKKVRDSRERGEMAVTRVEEENQSNREDLKKMSTELDRMQSSFEGFGEAYQAVENEKSHLMKSIVQVTEQLNLTNSELANLENERNEILMAFNSSKHELDLLRIEFARKNHENGNLVEKYCSVLLEAEVNFKHLVSTTLEKKNLNEITNQLGLDLVGSMQYGLELWVILENCFGKYLSEVNNNTFAEEILSEVVKFIDPWVDNEDCFLFTIEDNLRGFELAQKREVESFNSKMVEFIGVISQLFDLWMGEIEKIDVLKVEIDACYWVSTTCISKLEQENLTLAESLKDREKDSKERIEQLECFNQELAGKNESLQEFVEEKRSKISCLEEDLTTTKNEVAHLQADVVARNENISLLNNSLELLQAEKEKLLEGLTELRTLSSSAAEQSSRELDRKTCDFEARELSLVSEVAELHRMAGELRCEKEEAQKMGNQLKMENEDLRSQLSAMQLGAEEQGKNINALERSRKDFETRLQTLDGENSKLVAQLSHKTSLFEEAKTEETLLVLKLGQMEEGMNSLDLKLKENQAVIDELQSSNSEREQRVAQLEEEKFGISQELAKVSVEKEKLLEEIGSLQHQMNCCQSDIAAGEKLQNQVLKLSEENSRLKECLDTNQTNLEEREARIVELQQNESLSNLTIQRLEGDTRDLCQKMQFQVFKKQCVENEKSELQKTLNKVLQDRDHMLLEANTEIKGLREMNGSLKQDVKVLKEEMNIIKSEGCTGKVNCQNLSQGSESKKDNRDQITNHDIDGFETHTSSAKHVKSNDLGEAFSQNAASYDLEKDSDFDDLGEEDDDDDEDPFG